MSSGYTVLDDPELRSRLTEVENRIERLEHEREKMVEELANREGDD